MVETKMRRRLSNLSMFVVYFIFTILFLWRCSGGDAPTSSDLVVTGDVDPSAGEVGIMSTGGPTVGPISECEAVGLKRSGVRWQVDGRHQLLLFVPMSPEIGEPYVNVWTPDLNARLLGRGPANEWFAVGLPGFGSWRIQLAAETIDSTGRVRQCDRHRFVVLAKPPPPPPPPETCEDIEEPRCEVGLRVTRDEQGSVWFFAEWEVEDWCGRIELTRDDGFVFEDWSACAECVMGDGDAVRDRKSADSHNDPRNHRGTWTLSCVRN